jgi:hypothetical protein
MNDCSLLAPIRTALRVSPLPLWRVTNDESLLTHWTALNDVCLTNYSYVKVKVKVTLRLTFSQSVSLAHGQIFITLWQLWSCFCGAPLSDERTGLSVVYAAGPCQSSLSWVRVPWDSRPYFTVSDLRLSFSSPPKTRRVTVEVLDPASTRDIIPTNELRRFYNFQGTEYRSPCRTVIVLPLSRECLCLATCYLATAQLVRCYSLQRERDFRAFAQQWIIPSQYWWSVNKAMSIFSKTPHREIVNKV